MAANQVEAEEATYRGGEPTAVPMKHLARLNLAVVAIIVCGMGLVASLVGCGGGQPASSSAPPPSPSAPRFSRVFLVVMENMDYAGVIGSPFTPYINSLAAQYGLATNYFANTHPSIGNYFMLTVGEIVTNDSNFSGTVADDNLVRQFLASGKTWKVYAEDLPTAGYLDDNAYPYVKRHDPFAYFSDVRSNATQAGNIVPYNQTQFAAALAARTLPQFVYLLPNQHSNMHDCLPNNPSCTPDDKLAYGDNWLQQNLAPILADAEFQQSGLLILTFDEASDQDSTHGGGRIVTIIISGHSKPAFQSNTFYQHQSALRLICDELHLTSCPGAGSSAPRMSEFFQ